MRLTPWTSKTRLFPGSGGRSSARLEPQIVDLAVAGSNPVDHPIFFDLAGSRCGFAHIFAAPGKDITKQLGSPQPCRSPNPRGARTSQLNQGCSCTHHQTKVLHGSFALRSGNGVAQRSSGSQPHPHLSMAGVDSGGMEFPDRGSDRIPEELLPLTSPL